MNFTKEYITQCEKAEELQKAWLPNMGDFCSFQGIIHLLDMYTFLPHTSSLQYDIRRTKDYEKPDNARYMALKINDEWCYCAFPPKVDDAEYLVAYLDNQRSFYKKHAIWLPTQDQLQKIAGWTGEAGSRNIVAYLIDLAHFAFSEDLGFAVGNSWELLWLHYAMKVKHHMVWEENKWVLDSMAADKMQQE
jgi:hypothetical protein